MSKDFLCEIGCEELPSAAVKKLSEALKDAMLKALRDAELQHQGVDCYAAPRRLAIQIRQLQASQASKTVQRRGPAVAQAFDSEGKATKALEGFARSCNVTVEALQRMETPKGEWMVYEAEQSGQASSDFLMDALPKMLSKLPIAKPMRWGSHDFDFVRPVHWILALWGEEVLPLRIFNIDSDRYTQGHRFHANHACAVSAPNAYRDVLRAHYVIADFDERKAAIVSQVEALEQQLGAKAIMPEALLDEVCSIVEWPHALAVPFDAAFLEVPAEALIAAMQEHQKCFAMQNEAGELLPCFITIANIDSNNDAEVVAGNEKVMRARLSDAMFFYEQDKKQPLASHIEETKRVVFQEKLGSVYDKAQRQEQCMLAFAQSSTLDEAAVRRVAQLSKCDLMTGMVGEFPELQGLMGYYYARHDNESMDVAKALDEQYMPRFAKDDLPPSLLGKYASLADRVDTLVGIFSIGKKPTGVKDPFKLRRHALAVVRLLTDMPMVHSLKNCLEQALASYGERTDFTNSQYTDLKSFILDRLLSQYVALGYTQDMVQAVLAREDDNFADIAQRLEAMKTFVCQPETETLAQACKRVDNILRKNVAEAGAVDVRLLEMGEEKALAEVLHSKSKDVQQLQAQQEYGRILAVLAELKAPVDAFFDNVMVVVDDKALRENRLRLLLQLQCLLTTVADISKLSS